MATMASRIHPRRNSHYGRTAIRYPDPLIVSAVRRPGRNEPRNQRCESARPRRAARRPGSRRTPAHLAAARAVRPAAPASRCHDRGCRRGRWHPGRWHPGHRRRSHVGVRAGVAPAAWSGQDRTPYRGCRPAPDYRMEPRRASGRKQAARSRRPDARRTPRGTASPTSGRPVRRPCRRIDAFRVTPAAFRVRTSEGDPARRIEPAGSPASRAARQIHGPGPTGGRGGLSWPASP